MKPSVIFIILILIMTSLTFGQVQPKKIKMHKNPNAMKREIAKQIPIGSSIEDAQRIMEANGFWCVWKRGGSFTEGTEEKPSVEHSDIDFLYCRKVKTLLTDLPKSLIYMRLWEVAFVQKDGLVSD